MLITIRQIWKRGIIKNLVFILPFFLVLLFPNILCANILVISPHPDDDVVCASGIIYNAVQRHETVNVVYLTNGDLYGGTSAGLQRQNEAVNALVGYLGLNENNMIFLGYPDGGLLDIFNDYISQGDIYTSPNGQSMTYGNRGLGRTDYHSYQYGSHAPYNRYYLLMDLIDILTNLEPDHIIVTSEFDLHSDHSAAYNLLSEALIEIALQNPNYVPTIHKTIIHGRGGEWPAPGDPTTYFTEPDLSVTDLIWANRESFDVPLCMQSNDNNVNLKYQAINTHVSQGGVTGLLGRFLHKDEIFWDENILGSNQPPVVNAGKDQSVNASAEVQLDGSLSYDPEGTVLTYNWQQTGGTMVQLSNPTVAQPTFTAPANISQGQTLTFQLTVSDGQFTSMPDFVNITAIANQPTSTNIAPLATVTTSSQNTTYQQLATKAVDGVIDGYPGDYTKEWATVGEGSGAWLSLQWSTSYLVDRIVLYDRPNGNDQVLSGTITFSDGTILQVIALNNDGTATTYTFTPRVITGLTFKVTSVSSYTANIGLSEIHVYGYQSGSNPPVNQPPVANAGSDQIVNASATVQLDGSASNDPEGGALTYQWQQTSGTEVQLSNSTALRPTFTAPASTTENQILIFQLTVNDGELTSTPDTVNITIPSTQTINQAPIANAGSDQVVSWSATVQLDGSASFDPEGNTLTYQWQQTSGTTVQLSSVNVARPTFTAPASTTQDQMLSFQLTVSDGLLTSTPDTVNIAVPASQAVDSNIAPLATVTASSQNTTYQQLATKAVDGVIDGYPGDYTKEWATVGEGSGAWLSLQWSTSYLVDRIVLYDRPNRNDQVLSGTITFSDGTILQVIALNNDGTATTYTFTPRVITGLTFKVTSVSSYTANIGLSEIHVYGYQSGSNPPVNQPPIANAGSDQVVSWSATVQLDGSASFDPEGNTLTYQWQQTSGTTVQLSSVNVARPTFTAPASTTQDQMLSFQLTVSDGLLTSTPDTVNIAVPASQAVDSNIAPLATVTASSQNTTYQQLATKAVDGVIDGYPGDYTKEWATVGEGSGAWLSLQWSTSYLVDRIVLYDRPNRNDQVLSGTITFSDGTILQVIALNNDGTATTYTFTPRVITGLTFKVTSVSSYTANIGLSEIHVYGIPGQ